MRPAADLGELPPAPAPLAAFLERIEEMSSEGTGALRVEGARSSGAVLVEGGRICWAVVDGSARRLTDMLRAQMDPLAERGAIEALYRSCQRTGRPLGEALVQEGLVTEIGLRTALLDHSADAVASLSRIAPARLSWIEHRRRRYDARYSFSPLEVLAAVGSLAAPAEVHRALEGLRFRLAAGGAGVAYTRSLGFSAPLPLALVGAERLRLGEALELGRWAIDALEVARALSPSRDLVATFRRTGGGSAAWEEGATALAATFTDASSLAFALARHARSRAG